MMRNGFLSTIIVAIAAFLSQALAEDRTDPITVEGNFGAFQSQLFSPSLSPKWMKAEDLSISAMVARYGRSEITFSEAKTVPIGSRTFSTAFGVVPDNSRIALLRGTLRRSDGTEQPAAGAVYDVGGTLTLFAS